MPLMELALTNDLAKFKANKYLPMLWELKIKYYFINIPGIFQVWSSLKQGSSVYIDRWSSMNNKIW